MLIMEHLMLHDGLNIILKRNQFYRNNYHGIVLNLFLSIIAFCALVSFIYCKSFFSLTSKYFPTAPNGIIIKNPPYNVNHLLLDNFHFNDKGTLLEWPKINIKDLDLDAENSNENAILLYWTAKAMLSIFDLDYINFREVLQNARIYFTPLGYNSFLEALDASRNLETIKVGKRISSVVLINKPKVVDTGLIGGHKIWTVETPIKITYENITKDLLVQNLLAVTKIARISTLQSRFYGIAIYQLNLKPIVE